MVIPQPGIADNNTTEKPVAVTLQLKVAGNNALKKSLVGPLVKSQLDGPTKILTDIQDVST